MSQIITLGQFIVNQQNQEKAASGTFSNLLRGIELAAKQVNKIVNQAGLTDILGKTGAINAQGELVEKLDEYAHAHFVQALFDSKACCAIVSEEKAAIILPANQETTAKAEYIVAIDPLDGSSNIDVTVSVGTIFSIYRRESIQNTFQESDFFQKGSEQIAAGYIIYGSSTMLVYTTGHGVNGFTLDPLIGEFCLSHPDLTIPADGTIYSVNEGNFEQFSAEVKAYICYCKQPEEKTSRPYSARYTGSMVADIHRNLIKGGIFLYPATTKNPTGKIRLVYECNPLAFIITQAGGRATNGKHNILDLEVENLHQRSQIFIGCKKMVSELESFLAKKNN